MTFLTHHPIHGGRGMSESKHTPGPWETGEDRTSNSGATWIWIGPMSWTTRVARVVLYDGEEEMQRANARLIAAAPDLLEALKMLRDADLVAVTEGYSGTMGVEQRSVVDAAIAKAEGQP